MPFKIDCNRFVQDAFESRGVRLDAGETAVFGRQLETIMAESYDAKYVDNKARTIVPLNFSANPGADLITYRQFDYVTDAQAADDMSQEAPRVSISGQEFSSRFVSFRNSYGYSLMDWRRAQMAGLPLDSMLGVAARRGLENKFEILAAVGDTTRSVAGALPYTGLFNTATISIINTTTTSGMSGKVWLPDGGGTTAGAIDIYNDVMFALRQVYKQSKTLFMADTCVLPTNVYAYLATTLSTQANYNNQTVLQQLIENAKVMAPGFSVIPWIQANTGKAASGTGGRCVIFKKDPTVLQMMVATDFESFPPQVRGSSFSIENHMRIGSLQVRYPGACLYLDGTTGTVDA